MDGGIAKSSPVRLGGAFVTPVKGRRRETLGGVIGDRVYLPGSPVMTLEGLLQEAEVQVASTKKPTSSKESTEKSSATMKVSNVWTKDEWKLLDMCFTEERYVAGGGNIMAEVDDVDIDAVVWRFLELAPDSRWDKSVFLPPFLRLLGLLYHPQERTSPQVTSNSEEATLWEDCTTSHPTGESS